jgi:hypothetical protein
LASLKFDKANDIFDADWQPTPANEPFSNNPQAQFRRRRELLRCSVRVNTAVVITGSTRTPVTPPQRSTNPEHSSLQA